VVGPKAEQSRQSNRCYRDGPPRRVPRPADKIKDLITIYPGVTAPISVTHLGTLLENNRTSLEDYVEIIASGSLLDNRLAIIERACLQGIGHCQTLPFVQALQDGDARQELLVHFALADGRAHQDAAVGVAVDAPQLHIGLGPHGGGAWSAVDEGQFAKAAALADGGHQFGVDKDLKYSLVN